MNWNQWQSLSDDCVKELPYQVADWLLEFGSLTEKLNRHSKNPVKLDLLLQAPGTIASSEQQAMATDANQLPQREVVLYANDKPWIFARTIVSEESQQLIEQLGQQPLGSILFNNEHLRRQFLQIKKTFPEDELYQKAVQHLDHCSQEFLWARRSLWNNQHQEKRYALLVNEVFLPASPLY